MTPPLGLRSLLARWACALAALACAGCHAPDELAATRAWIAQARRQARPELEPAPLPQAQANQALASAGMETVPDPFGLQQREAERQRVQAQQLAQTEADEAAPAIPAAPPIRVLGTLVRDASAYVLLQIDGQTFRLGAGDALPNGRGRVLRVDEDTVELASGSDKLVLRLDDAATIPTLPRVPIPSAGKEARGGKRRLVRPGAAA
jgi:Tfp pilus assembly protein PilP